MHKILKKRVVLIRSMVDAVEDMPTMHKEIKAAEVDAIRKIIGLVRKDDKQHFISLSTDTSGTNISYCKVPEQKYEIPKRVMTNLSRYLTRHYPDERAIISDSALDKYIRRVGVHLNKASAALLDARIRIYHGKEIRERYRNTEAHSCMTRCNSFKVNLYELNSDKVALVELDGQVRALLWTDDEGVKILDRAYPAGHNKIDLLRLWAESKGYVLRNVADQNVVDNTIELNDHSKRKVTLKHSGCFPFLDTFRYGQFDGTSIILSNDYEFGNIKLTTDQGTYAEVVRCIKCGDRRNKPREVLVDGDLDTIHICDTCYSKMFFQCGQCGKNNSIRRLAIEASKNKNRRNYCKKCVLMMQKHLQFNDCTCDNCLENKRHYKELFQSAGINVNEDVMNCGEDNAADL